LVLGGEEMADILVRSDYLEKDTESTEQSTAKKIRNREHNIDVETRKKHRRPIHSGHVFS
jgi:hypothetical protein